MCSTKWNYKVFKAENNFFGRGPFWHLTADVNGRGRFSVSSHFSSLLEPSVPKSRYSESASSTISTRSESFIAAITTFLCVHMGFVGQFSGGPLAIVANLQLPQRSTYIS